MSIAIGIAVLFCLLGAYFGACNIAIKGLSRKRFSDVLDQRQQSADYDRFIRRMPQLLLTTGIIRALASLIVLLATLYEVERIWGPGLNPTEQIGGYLIAFVVAGLLVSVFIVAIPASWAKYHREQLVAWSMPLLWVMAYLLWPITALLHGIDPIVRRISGADLNAEGKDSDLSDELLAAVEDHEASADVQDEQKDMLEAVFELPGIEASEIMTPRTDIQGVEIHSSLDDIKAFVMDVGHSRIPVYEESLDNIHGILYVKDLIQFLGDGKEFDLRSVLRESFLVPESKSVAALLEEFKDRQVHLAIVIDEYGGTAGLITIEDILEEIVGEIQDEYEPIEQAPMVVRLSDDAVEVDARMEIDAINDELDIELPEDEDYDTLGGFMFAKMEHIPEQGESFAFDGLTFEVVLAERTRVNRVKISGLAAEPVKEEA